MHIISWETNGIHRVYSGIVNWPDLEQSVIKVHADIRYEKAKYIINNFLDCTSLELTDENMEEISARNAAAERSHRSNNGYKVAFVARSSTIRWKVSTYLDIGIATSPAGVFYCLEDARKWISD